MAQTVADKIAEWLYEKGITHAFGVIGGGNVNLWDAITRLGKTQIVCVHHEQAAAMASGYFNRTANLLKSICLVTTGGGSSNAVTGILAAFMDRVPLMVISGNEASKYMEQPQRVWGVQGYDSVGMAAKAVKDSLRMQPTKWNSWKAPTVLNFLERALLRALEPPQGPVWIDIPKDVQSAPL